MVFWWFQLIPQAQRNSPNYSAEIVMARSRFLRRAANLARQAAWREEILKAVQVDRVPEATEALALEPEIAEVAAVAAQDRKAIL